MSAGKRLSSEICRMVGNVRLAQRRCQEEPWHHRRAVSPPPIELLLGKIGLSAGIVIGVTLAAERLGPRLGGLLRRGPRISPRPELVLDPRRRSLNSNSGRRGYFLPGTAT